MSQRGADETGESGLQCDPCFPCGQAIKNFAEYGKGNVIFWMDPAMGMQRMTTTDHGHGED